MNEAEVEIPHAWKSFKHQIFLDEEVIDRGGLFAQRTRLASARHLTSLKTVGLVGRGGY